MFTIEVETRFWASHQLTLPDGSKEPLHYHNWAVIAEVSSDKLDNTGLVTDFGLLRAMVEEITAGFDNVWHNNIDYFRRNNPSTENVAQYIFDKLEPKLPRGVKLRSIRVIEEPGCSAKFSTP
jgi:6-pyruvoyltetrahydropterin/6-carboxytetrahydropterin synthase